MNWEQVQQRGREVVGAVRARITRRRVVRAFGVVAATGFVAIAAEALIRGHLGDPGRRVPSALYTRPVAWGADRASREPVAIGALDGMMEERVPITLRDLPASLVQAILAVEDQRFYQHHGVDLRRIVGALLANFRAGGITQGGSTLTQQLAKNLFLSASRTPLRKMREAALATVLEMRYDKTRILEAYLNEIYLGQDGGRAIHGVGAAARYYFGKDVRRLSLAESALLAGTINSPNHNAPNRHADVARQRRDLVLGLMADQHRISRAAAEQAMRATIPIHPHPALTIDARNFRDYALAALPDHVPARGEAVYTTLDATLQRAAERAVAAGTARWRDPGVQAALVAIDPRNGEVLAMVGGRDYGASQFNRATMAHRQPGSAFKPLVAATALARDGDRAPAFTLASVVPDEPLRVESPGGVWEPADYDGSFRGPVTVREAMEQSLNIPFARIGLAVGPERIVATARKMGIASPLDAVPSLALGSSGVTLLELVRAYGVLAAAGDLAPTRTMFAHAHYGDTLPVLATPAPVRVIDPAVAYLVTSALQGVVMHGTGSALSTLGHDDQVAGKTGTSSNYRDAWFVAYSTSLVVGVWVGYDDERSLRMTGAAAALPIVQRFLAEATTDDDYSSFEVPDGVIESSSGTGDWGSACGGSEYFLSGTEPAESNCLPFEPPPARVFRRLGGEIEFNTHRLEQWIARHLTAWRPGRARGEQ